MFECLFRKISGVVLVVCFPLIARRHTVSYRVSRGALAVKRHLLKSNNIPLAQSGCRNDCNTILFALESSGSYKSNIEFGVAGTGNSHLVMYTFFVGFEAALYATLVRVPVYVQSCGPLKIVAPYSKYSKGSAL